MFLGHSLIFPLLALKSQPPTKKRTLPSVYVYFKRYVIWTIIFITTYETIIDLQRKVDIDTKTKTIKRKTKNII